MSTQPAPYLPEDAVTAAATALWESQHPTDPPTAEQWDQTLTTCRTALVAAAPHIRVSAIRGLARWATAHKRTITAPLIEAWATVEQMNLTIRPDGSPRAVSNAHQVAS